ncbi:MAG: hypothetical protein UT32_C0005G0005 [Parcubacteria group bacterium GW2011_GWC2_39_14]|nr:MAG: hypothetical protein UT32_C0005G0005 [Parcubacteria group bacterium GW2011_GWC2_39_14]KKR54586.1 MAG: hypothetical protein UT91_C0012G0005 [Parcubacteria group bacterium GW2011_GWA2_40_23]
MAHKKNQQFNVNPGDVVVLNFEHRHVGGIETVTVLTVTKRFGGMGDLISYIDPTSGEERHCDAKFVTMVTFRATQTSLPNRFRDNRRRYPDQNDPLRPQRGVLAGTLEGLVSYCLAKLPFALEHPVHEDRMKALYLKQRPGQIMVNWDCVYTVHEKVFQAWVRANARKICATRQEADAQQREDDAAWEADCQADYEADMDRELSEALPEPQEDPVDYGNPIDDDDPAYLDDYGPLDADDLQAIRIHESESGIHPSSTPASEPKPFIDPKVAIDLKIASVEGAYSAYLDEDGCSGR